MRNILLNFAGITLPIGSFIYAVLEKATPVLGFIALCISIIVGISALIVNRKKAASYDRQKRIDNEFIFKKNK